MEETAVKVDWKLRQSLVYTDKHVNMMPVTMKQELFADS